jgi:hypothetical protein
MGLDTRNTSYDYEIYPVPCDMTSEVPYYGGYDSRGLCQNHFFKPASADTKAWPNLKVDI